MRHNDPGFQFRFTVQPPLKASQSLWWGWTAHVLKTKQSIIFGIIIIIIEMRENNVLNVTLNVAQLKSSLFI